MSYGGKRRSWSTPLTILFLSDTYEGKHDKRIADTTPIHYRQAAIYLKIWASLAFRLDGVSSITPSRNHVAANLTDEGKAFNQQLARTTTRTDPGISTVV